MALPYRVESLDDVPETARELYEEADDGFRLPVKGVDEHEEVQGLKSKADELLGAVTKLKEQRNQYRDKAERVSDEDLEELERLRREAKKREEAKAKEEGRWEELRTKLQKEHEEKLAKERGEKEERDRVIEDLTVTSELRSAIADAGFDTKYHEAVEALLLRRDPQVQWEDGKPRGIFPDDVHGPKPIAEYVAEWAETEAAKAYMPPDKGGSGAPGEKDHGGRTVTKKISEMSDDEKAVVVDSLVEQYGEDWQAKWYEMVAAG